VEFVADSRQPNGRLVRLTDRVPRVVALVQRRRETDVEVLEHEDHDAPAVPHQAGAWVTLHQGDPVLAAGVREIDRCQDPLDLEPQGTSVALVLEKDGLREWWLLAEQPGGVGSVVGTAVSTPAGSRFASFERWLDFQVALAHGEQPGPAVTFSASGELQVTGPNATLLAQRTGIDLGTAFAGPAERTAVAKVQHEGVVWYVLAREVGGVPEYLPTISDATTIDEYLVEALTYRWATVATVATVATT
jgi:hypothetical protein